MDEAGTRQTFAQLIGRKGGKSGKKGGEDPNTLQSDATASMVDVLCEGPIAGLWAGNGSVYLNNVPLVPPFGLGGTPNFLGIVNDFRTGLPDQDPFVGPTTVENPTLVGVKVTNGQGDSHKF